MKKYIFVSGYVLCATVLSRFTADQSLGIRHAVWSLVALILFLSYARSMEVPRSWIFPVFGGYLVIASVTMLWATNPIKGLYELSKIVLMIATLYMAWDILRKNKDFVIKALSVLGLTLGAYSLYEMISTGNVEMTMGTMGIRNLWASAQLLLLPLCVYSIKKWKAVGIISSGLIVFNLLILFNRSSILALAVVSMIFMLYHKRLRKAVLILFIVIFIVCIINPHFLNTGSMRTRYAVWDATSRVFRENPFFGIGINNWQVEISRYASLMLEPDVFSKRFYHRPHNDYLWVLSETGLFGFACYISVFGLGVYYAIKTRNIRALTGISGYMVIAFFSFPKERAFHSLMLIFYLADALSECEFKTIKMPRYVPIPVLVALCLVVAEFNLCFRSDMHIHKLTIARDRKEWTKVLSEADKISFLRTMDRVTIPIAWYTGEAHYFLGDHDQAIKDTAKAFRHNPNNVYVLDRMGSILEGLGDLKGAESCYRRALRIQPGFEYSLKKLINLLGKNYEYDRECR